MCLPLPITAGVVMAAGSLYSGYTALQQGNYEAAVAKQNAALDVERARDSIERGRLEARDFYRQVGRTKGEQVAAMAANGIDVGFGTAARIRDDTRMLAREDAENLYKNIHERTRGFEISAANSRAEGRAAKFRGRTQAIGSIFQAASSVAGGLQQQRAIDAANGGGSLMGRFQQQRGMRAKLGRPSSSASWYVGY